MRALRDMNLPKFVFEDVPLFLGLISDLFPGLDCPRVRYPNFNDAVEQALVENNYILLPQQVKKYSMCVFMELRMFCGKQDLRSLKGFSWFKLNVSYSRIKINSEIREIYIS